ncbi:YidH family protein [Synechococcus sp. PCC 7336]|uniref:YidH family protein n=1 Tax=Synechococcus sp. PCC 7336 TaxID=195250 RepID=UPI0012EA2605|nr:DUF202 domain-containing protein [Synechococcus sp. PCC 7336]
MPGDDRQREHQANERTFLAWVRTSLSLIGIGLALARFSLFIRELSLAAEGVNGRVAGTATTLLGAVMVAIGIGIIGLGLWEYNRAYRQIESGLYRPNRTMVWIVAIAVALLGLLSLPLTIWRSAGLERDRPLALPAAEQKSPSDLD